MLCAFRRRTGEAEVVEAPAEAVLTRLPSAPSIGGIVWRAEDIGGGYALDRGALSFTSELVATQKACAPSLMEQERRFLAILGAARRIELLLTGALLVSTPDGKSLRFFPEQSVKPGGR